MKKMLFLAAILAAILDLKYSKDLILFKIYFL